MTPSPLPKTRPYRRLLLLALIVLAVLAFDQTTKTLISARLALEGSLPVLEPVLYLTLSANTGAAFGFLPQAGDLFLILAVVIVIGMVLYYPRIPDAAHLTRLGIALICGGALGNAIDRVLHGHVIDFVHIIVPGVISNVSNFADHFIVLGVGAMFYDSWFGALAQRAAPQAAQTPKADDAGGADA